MDQRIEIVHEDGAVIVCHKYSGIAVQTAAPGQADMVSELKKHLAKQGGSNPYLAVIHRLDQPVEGLLVFAKTEAAAAVLSKQVQDHAFTKEYTALVYGKMPQQQDELTDHLVKDARSNTSRVVSEKDKNGKRSVLHYEVIEEAEKTQTLRILLKTGRHHQIRVQLSHAGCPILGDTKYGTEEAKRYALEQGIGKLCLCASRLEFTHPVTGKRMEYSIG
ncbi:MAG: RluA family pseudouridine synthase [Lachnospiraceae bacterium]|nr:RluA family pseudouridine synthase [Lachnospiraceae bacterium]